MFDDEFYDSFHVPNWNYVQSIDPREVLYSIVNFALRLHLIDSVRYSIFSGNSKARGGLPFPKPKHSADSRFAGMKNS